jgi:hypothetical protein
MYDDEVGIIWEDIRRRIAGRVNANRYAFDKLNLDRFYIAGGALLPPEPDDYDLFPVHKKDFNKFFISKNGRRKFTELKVGWETPNAVTYKVGDIKIQLCKFWNESLMKTVGRFDFTHCKLGVEFERRYMGRKDEPIPIFVVKDLYVSEDFIRYKILGYSEYTGIQEGDYPLSSLLRVFKYIKKEYIRSSYDVVFKILEAILVRGYKDQDDFMKQLAGIDVGIDEAQQLEDNAKILQHIYFLLTGKVIDILPLFDRELMLGEIEKRENRNVLY